MNKGFSLVELIVVIAIMAILVGVAVPVYTSYITKAKQASDIQAIDNLEHACKIVGIEYNINIVFTESSDKTSVTATLDDEHSDVEDAYAQLVEILGDSVTPNATARSFTVALDTKVDGTDVKLPSEINPKE